MKLYEEAPDNGNEYRTEISNQLAGLLNSRREQARIKRATYFRPNRTSTESYKKSIAEYREAFVDLLGWPLNTAVNAPPREVHEHLVGEDDLCRIYRIWVHALPELDTYGLLLLPKASSPSPLLISQHGGGGTPELCSIASGPTNYNDMSRRAVRKGFAVFAPQLPLWRDNCGPAVNHNELDQQLKHLGSSMAAVNIFQIQRSIDALLLKPEIDSERVGIMGLSWGGFYALTTAAIDIRIKAVLTSCFFNDRDIHPLPPATWFNAANQFQDAEIAAMVCPRPLYVEVGTNDEMFRVETARTEAEEIRQTYEELQISDHFQYVEHAGAHEFNREDTGLDFLCKWL